MAVCVVAVYVVVVVDEVSVAGVVGRVDVYNVDFAGVGVGECCQRYEVVPLDNNMIWDV